jgi:hypothetical protein
MLISATRFAMSCRPLKESAQDPETPNPVTPTKPPRNAGACHCNQDAENLDVSAKLLSLVMLASIDQICFTARLWVGINISEE